MQTLYELLSTEYSWIEQKDKEFKAAMQAIFYTSDNLAIMGSGGTGKSTLLELLNKTTPCLFMTPTATAARVLQDKEMNAYTIHSILRLQSQTYFPSLPDVEGSTVGKISKVSTVVIDEIGMVNSNLLDTAIRMIKFVNPKIRIILTGDIFQIPAIKSQDKDVISRFEKVYNGISVWFGSLEYNSKIHNFKTLFLHHNYRAKSDPEWGSILERMRIGDTTKQDLDIINSRVMPLKNFEIECGDIPIVEILSTHKLTDNKNKVYIDSIQGTEYISELQPIFNEKFEWNDNLIKIPYKVGAQVMATRNCRTRTIKKASVKNKEEQIKLMLSDAPWSIEEGVDGKGDEIFVLYPDGGYENGEIGVITSIINNNTVRVKFPPNEEIRPFGREIIMGPSIHEEIEWTFIKDKKTKVEEAKGKIIATMMQVDFVVCKAILTHKAQGQTFDKVYCYIPGYHYTAALTYTALSRVRNLKDLALDRPLRLNDIVVDQDCNTFYEEKYLSEAKNQRKDLLAKIVTINTNNKSNAIFLQELNKLVQDNI
jgi:hypothetical protein